MMNETTFSLAEKEAKEKLQAAVRRLNECYKETKDLTKQIADLRSVIAAFARMRNEEFVEEEEFGMTDGIRLVLARSGLALTAEEVRNGLYGIGFDTDSYENVMAAIGTALKRLANQNEVSVSQSPNFADGKTRYQLTGNSVTLKTLTHGFKPGTYVPDKKKQ